MKRLLAHPNLRGDSYWLRLGIEKSPGVVAEADAQIGKAVELGPAVGQRSQELRHVV
jgi:hypothetical protein